MLPLIMVTKLSISSVFCCCIAATFFGCVNDASTPPVKELKLGDSTVSNTITVPVGGGRFFFNSADTQNSVRIIFPPNTYPTSKTINLTASNISRSSFDANVTPISWLYTVDAGSDFANKDIIIDIPVSLDTNNFSMAFLYDRVTHELEGVPTVGYYPKSKPQLFSVTLRRSGSLFLSTILKSKLATNVSSSFDPKMDNWEFPNYGTMATPNGQFAGQSLSALWYYYEQQQKGNPHLYGKFDIDHGGESPKIWQDNDLGFRVAAQTQLTLNWNNFAYTMMAPLNNGNAVLTLYQVCYSMMVTNKPQLITVIKDSTILPLIVYKVINGLFYIADPNYPTSENQTMYSIVDHADDYRTGISMLDLENGGSKFIHPTYIGVRSMIDWDAITRKWTDAQNNIFTSFLPYTVTFSDKSGDLAPTANGFMTLYDTVSYTIGNGQPAIRRIYLNNNFSVYTTSNTIPLNAGENNIHMYFLNLATDGIHELWSGFVSAKIQIQLFTITPSLDTSFVESDIIFHAVMAQKPTEAIRYEWDMGDGSPVIKNTNIDSNKYRYQKTGTYRVSLSIWMVSSNTLLGKGISTVTINTNSVLLVPSKVTGITGVGYNFYGIINVSKDIVQRCEWDMGDGTGLKRIIGTDSIFYSYKNSGLYTIKLQIFNNTTGNFLGSAQSTISLTNVTLPTLSQLESMNFVNVKFAGNHTYYYRSMHNNRYSDSYVSKVDQWTKTLGSSSDTSSQKIVWNNLIFSTKFQLHDYKDDSCGGVMIANSYQDDDNSSISGSLAGDLSLINISLSNSHYERTYHFDCDAHNTEVSEFKSEFGFDCIKVNLLSNSTDTIRYSISGPIIQFLTSHLSDGNSKVSDARSWLGRDLDSYSSSSDYTSTNWNDAINAPIVTITFYK